MSVGNYKNVRLAGCRKKYNRAKRQVDSLRKIFKEEESSEVAEKLAEAEARLSRSQESLVKARSNL